MKNVLILGVCGFLGSNLAKKLLNNSDIRVFGLDNLENNDISPIYEHLKSENFIFTQGDILDGIEQTPDEIYYLAGSGDKSEYFNNKSEFCIKQIKMVEKAINVSVLSGAKIVFALDFNEILDTNKLKLYRDYNNFIESLILNSIENNSLNAKILKIADGFGENFKSSDKRFINRAIVNALNNNDIVLTYDCEKHYIYADDIINALINTMENYYDKNVLNIFNPNKTKISDIANLIVKCAKSKSKVILKEGGYKPLESDISNIISDFSLNTPILEGILKTVNYEKFMQF